MKNAVQVEKLFQTIMERCRLERRAKTDLTIRTIAKQLDKTENYLSSVEHAREYPSLKTFLEYLLVCGFDTTLLTKLEIPNQPNAPTADKDRAELLRRVYTLDDAAVSFLVEQSKVAEVFNVKVKTKRRR